MTSQDADRTANGSEEERQLWQLAQGSGIGRRRFLQLLSVGGAAAVLSACGVLNMPGRSDETPAPVDVSTPESQDWFKDATPFVQRSGSLEARLENLQGVITPNKFFFVRNNSGSIDVDADIWRLSVEGDAVSNPIELSYEDIRNLPSRTLISYLECAGNHRVMFNLVNGQEAEGTQWGRGAIGNGEWTGVSLKDVLTRAGINDEAVSVLLIGLDAESPEEGFRRVLPVEKPCIPTHFSRMR